jgi:pimeloyl-ACP methyl ester carboxylesterase
MTKTRRGKWVALYLFVGKYLLLGGLFLGMTDVQMGNAEASSRPPAFHVDVFGDGPDMILISGLACGNNVWDKTVASFQTTYRVHVITLAGFGDQPGIEAPYMKTVRDAIITYIREQKMDRPIIIGHSLGGMLAFWICVTAPNAVGPMIAVDGLPSLGALHNKKPDSWMSRIMVWFISRKLKKQTQEEFAIKNRENLKKMITSPEDIKTVAKLSGHSDPRTVGQAFYEMMTFDIRREVQGIQSPVLLLGATADSKNDKDKQKKEMQYREQVATIAEHEVVFAPKALHFIQLDEPVWFVEQVKKFLAKHSNK